MNTYTMRFDHDRHVWIVSQWRRVFDYRIADYVDRCVDKKEFSSNEAAAQFIKRGGTENEN